MTNLEDQLVDRFDQRVTTKKSRKEVTDFDAFYKYIYGWSFPKHFVSTLALLYDRKQRTGVISIPPGHGKTTLLIAYAAWCIGNNPNIRIIIATHTLTYSESIVDQIGDIVSLPQFIDIFGDIVPKGRDAKWTRGNKTVIRDDFRLKDPTLIAVGVGSSTIGLRCDLILGDDLVTQPNSMTDVMRKHISEWYYGSLEKRLDPDGIIRVFGARFYSGDLYKEIVNKGAQQVILEATPDKPLWPEMFDAELLRTYEENDYATFQAQYRQNPIDMSTNFLRESWLDYYLELPDNLRYYVGVDPCAKDTLGTDFISIAIIGFDANGTGYIIDIIKGQGGLHDQADMVERVGEQYNPIIIGIETNNSQGWLIEELEKRALESGTGLRFRPIQTQLPKEIRFMAMSNYFRNRKILLPGSFEMGFLKHHPRMEEFVRQWRAFPSPQMHDDMLDSVDHCLSTALGVGVLPASAMRRLDRKALAERLQKEREERRRRIPNGRTVYSYRSIFH